MITAWRDAGRPDITDVRVRITSHAHTYRIGETPGLCWEHRLA